MDEKVPHTMTTLECPNSKKPCEVNFEINVFRGASHGGVEAITCTEFLHNNGVPTCGQECIHSAQAQHAHDQEIRKHQEELSKIGRNVIG
jgi:hypothetical protein